MVDGEGGCKVFPWVGSCWNDDVVARVESNNEDTISCERWRVFILNLELDL